MLPKLHKVWWLAQPVRVACPGGHHRSWQDTPSHWLQCMTQLNYKEHDSGLTQTKFVLSFSPAAHSSGGVTAQICACMRVESFIRMLTFLSRGSVETGFTKFPPFMETKDGQPVPQKIMIENQGRNIHITPLFHQDRRKIKFLAPS